MHPHPTTRSLGKIIKEAGLRQECLSGYDFVTVEWYRSTGAMIDGLMKNIFALANFNTTLAWPGPWYHPCSPSCRHGASCSAMARPGSSSPSPWPCVSPFSVRRPRHEGLTPWLAPAALITPYITVYTILQGHIPSLKNKGSPGGASHYPWMSLRRKNRSLF